jgi:hypothetical protein
LDESTCWHEAGHAAAAHALGRPVTLVTSVPGGRFAGCTRARVRLVAAAVPDVDTPFSTWGGRWMERLTGDAVWTLAGDVAEDLFGRRDQARLPPTTAELALDELATTAEFEKAGQAVNDEALAADAEALAGQLHSMFGADLTRAAAWLRWCEEETRALLLYRAGSVRRLQGLLAEHGTLGEAAAARALGGDL